MLLAISVYSGLIIPLSVYLLTGCSRTPLCGIEEAARIDDYGPAFGLLWGIVLSCSGAADLLHHARRTMDAERAAYHSGRPEATGINRTLMARLMRCKGRSSTNDPLVIPDTLIATVQMLLLYLFGHRLFTHGPVAGIER